MVTTSPQGNKMHLQAVDPYDLRRQLPAINTRVGKPGISHRDGGRTTELCERWYICRLLSAYCDAGLLRFPLDVEHSDRPDLVLRMPDRTVGIELSEMILPDQAQVAAERGRRSLKGQNVPPRLISSFSADKQLGKEKIQAIARGEDTGHQYGWVGDSVERMIAEMAMRWLEKKSQNFTKPGYQRFEQNKLLLYDNLEHPHEEMDEAAVILQSSLKKIKHPFDSILILTRCGKFIWEISSRSIECHPVGQLQPKTAGSMAP